MTLDLQIIERRKPISKAVFVNLGDYSVSCSNNEQNWNEDQSIAIFLWKHISES